MSARIVYVKNVQGISQAIFEVYPTKINIIHIISIFMKIKNTNNLTDLTYLAVKLTDNIS